MLVGAQMLLTLSTPWLPHWLCRRGPSRGALQRFLGHSRTIFLWLERRIQPRLDGVIAHPAASAFTGLQLVLLGFLLALPIPFTNRSEEHTSELQSLMRISYAVFCLKKKNTQP